MHATPASDRAPGAQLIGRDPAFLAFLERLERVAAGVATVLIQGEHGTGKSLAAARLHALSPRAAGPLVRLHLGALAPTLIESELFGHERGAFTDARQGRLGAFRRADGGTLILDDVGLLPLPSQVKLLRVLQERVVEPVGAETAVPVDLRIVATAAVDLAAEVEAGRFREDLYWRLAVVPLQVPPLRARRGDVVPLAEALCARVAARLCLVARPVSPEAAERLVAHPWPGNVRELENALERVHALAVCPGPIEASEFDFLQEGLVGAADDLAKVALGRGIAAEELERALLRAALAEERGNVSAAARRVGLSRRTFEYRLGRGSAEGGAA